VVGPIQGRGFREKWSFNFLIILIILTGNCTTGKARLNGFTKSFALELDKTKVTVNAICPGYIRIRPSI
jgi:NAD(P)-dependent dehydrogenase (short-subunit alcohol dehydrogenase family)